MLCKADTEFIPSLSSRKLTTQDLSDDEHEKNVEPFEYYCQMIKQSFVLTVKNDQVVGFLSFIPSYILKIELEEFRCDYISTIIVKPEYRGNGITERMYMTLFNHRAHSVYATRTWSTNISHLHILEKLGFREIHRIPNERGENIDTIYFAKKGDE